jgi:hypothetical protein
MKLEICLGEKLVKLNMYTNGLITEEQNIRVITTLMEWKVRD